MTNVKAVKQNIDAVTMELGGRERTIQFDMNAFAELENKYGSVQKAMKELQGGGMKDVRMILWVGLIHDEAIIDKDTGEATGYKITPYQVGSWIKNPDMLKEASMKLNQAFGGSATSIDSLPEEVKEQLKEQGIDVEAIQALEDQEEAKNE